LLAFYSSPGWVPLRVQLCHWRQPTLWVLPMILEMLRPLPKVQDLWKA
jgi:hypothetical protein